MNFCSMVISSMGTPSTITVKHVERLGPQSGPDSPSTLVLVPKSGATSLVAT
jgi:hypothetical protein